MKVSLCAHYPEEVLERYSLGMLSTQESAPVEEHLLLCSTCKSRLETIDEYILIVKTAAALLREGPAGPRRISRKPVCRQELQACS